MLLQFRKGILALAGLIVLVSPGCGQPTGGGDAAPASQSATPTQTPAGPSTSGVAAPANTTDIVIAGGCFWCMEIAFEQLRGVTDVVSGYAGGSKETAEYGTVSAGLSKHAEAIRITYDPAVISYEDLLRVFFMAAHDPTQINRQTPDVGRQYRSAIFYANDEQQQVAAKMIGQLNQSGQFEKKIATTLEPLAGFYVAEDYHQDYAKHHPDDRYVMYHSIPKRDKVRKMFGELLRDE